jgi:predicted esterase
MNLEEKEISYTTTNTYATLNSLTDKTKNIWFVCHGMGYLSRYFLRYFSGLNADENYVVAPQAQSKYYIPPKFKHVGSSWLTKENTIKETENVMRNFDAIFEAEQLPTDKNLIVLGYSQGVSVAMRYIARRKLQCSQLVIHSGGIPKELTPEDFSFLNAKISMIYGTEDEYLNEEYITHEIKLANKLFDNKLKIFPFEGTHIVNVELINALV